MKKILQVVILIFKIGTLIYAFDLFVDFYFDRNLPSRIWIIGGIGISTLIFIGNLNRLTKIRKPILIAIGSILVLSILSKLFTQGDIILSFTTDLFERTLPDKSKAHHYFHYLRPSAKP